MAGKRSSYARAARRAVVTLKRLPSGRGRSTTAPGRHSYLCPYCSKTLDSCLGRDRHILLRPYCRDRHQREVNEQIRRHNAKKRKREGLTSDQTDTNTDQPPKRLRRDNDPSPSVSNPSPTETPLGSSETSTNPPAAEQGPCTEKFPWPKAGAPISDARRGHTLSKDDLRDYLASCGSMGDPDKFDAAELLMTTGLTAKNRTRWLKSSLCRGKKLWPNSRKLVQAVDRLPYGPKWTDQKIPIGEGEHRRTHILFKRDVVELVQELIGDARFKRTMRYAPVRHWSSSERKKRVFGEMWTANWWWEMQYLIGNQNGTIAPLIIASDKTHLSTMSGGQKAYPVYLTIGNISKTIRRKASKRATLILGYLPVDDFKDITNEKLRSKLRGELLHRSLEALLEPLKTASRHGVLMWCADGRLRHVYPVLAAYVGDWPEQNDVSCTVRSGCPVCQQPFHGRGSGTEGVPMRDQEETLAAFQAYAETGNLAKLKPLKLKPWQPFWAHLPHVDFPSCITPDLLHQLHKGVFKDHVMSWTEELLGEATLDARFMAMPGAKDLRHFKKGTTSVEQWTGRETKEMAKQYLLVIADDPKVPDDFVEMTRALLDFMYLAHSAELTEDDLTEMEQLLRKFHELKKILVKLGIMTGLGQFDHIPKFHMLGHYTHSIRALGTPDGYNTESPEHLHIVFAKRGWRASNRREAIRQIIAYVRRLEAIRIHRAYMDEYFGEYEYVEYIPDEDNEDEGGEDEDEDEDGETAELEGIEDSLEPVPYPQPRLEVAVHPTCPRVTGHNLIGRYGATDLLRSAARFLKPYAREAGLKPIVLPTDLFNVWHKVTLRHRSIPFAPYEPTHTDVVRIRPPDVDEHNRLMPGTFDTALFLNRPEATGLERYRIGRVRAIFTLPPRLLPLYPGHLVYLELFAPIKTPASPHRMPAVSYDYHDGQHRGFIIPLEQLSMACHLGPRFSSLDRRSDLSSQIDSLSVARNFFLNPYYNHFSYLYFRYWRGMGGDG